MLEILPAILETDPLKFQEKIDILEGHTAEVQIDVMDGVFVPHTTFADPSIIGTSKTSLEYELHLMVADPRTTIEAWRSIPSVKRVIIHAEIKQPLEPIIEIIKSHGWEAGVAINPETAWQQIDEVIPLLDTVLVMTVHPGAAGQPFADAVVENHLLAKITDLHEAHPGIVISVDGGVSAETISYLRDAGASRFIVGSALWSSNDPLDTLKQLQTLLIQ